jgi:hypothetical protein
MAPSPKPTGPAGFKGLHSNIFPEPFFIFGVQKQQASPPLANGRGSSDTPPRWAAPAAFGAHMERYFIDLRDVNGVIADDEGAQFDHLEDALEEAKESARDLAKQYLDNRRSVTEACVEIRNAKGQTVATLTVQEVMAHPVHPAFKSKCADKPQQGHH